MFIFLLTSLSLSFYTLANPISQNLDAIVVADNSLNAEGVKNSNNLNFPQNTLVAGPNLVELPSIDCTSDASTNEISDESTSTSEFNRRSASSCPVNYGSMPDAITQTREEHAGERKPSEPSKNPCSDYPKTKLFTCGGPIIGHPEFPWAGAADPFDDKILNCFQGPATEIAKKWPFRATSIVARFCCAAGATPPLDRVAQCYTLPGFPTLHHWNIDMFRAWARSNLQF